MAMTLNAMMEENPESWRTNGDEFYYGIRQGVRTVSQRLARYGDGMEARVSVHNGSRIQPY
jgi:hypothetical protein